MKSGKREITSNRTDKSRNNQYAWRERKLQVFGGLRSGRHQTSGDGRKNKKCTLKERESFSEPSSVAEISSKG